MWQFAVPLIISVAGFCNIGRRNRERLKSWQDAVAASGLRVETVSSPWAFRLRLEAGGGPLAVRITDARGDRPKVVITVAGPPGFSAVRIRPQPSLPTEAREIEVGDAAFDAAFFVEGPARLVSALLDAEMRRLLRDVKSACELEIGGGEIRVGLDDSQLDLLLPLVAEAGRRIAKTVDVRRQLAVNAQEDPSPRVRLRNLLLLARELPEAPDTVEALRGACLDTAPEVRLGAALELGAEGRETLLELADSEMPDAVSAQAVKSLGRELPFERVKDILAHALRRRRLQTAQSCVEVLGRSGEAMAVDILAAVLEREGSGLAVAAARALAVTGSPAAEAPLLRMVQREQTDVQVAAATALGRVGTATAVLPLKEAAAASEAATRPELIRAARQAVAEIQSRLQGASPGQLSLAQSEAGQLSLAVDPAGQLSISGDDAAVRVESHLPPGQRGTT